MDFNKVKYLRVYFQLGLSYTVIMLNIEKYKPQIVEYPLSSVIHGNKPIDTPRYKITHGSIRGVIRPILMYEEVVMDSCENIYIIEKRGSEETVVLTESAKKRILDTVGKWAEKNWQEMPTHI